MRKRGREGGRRGRRKKGKEGRKKMYNMTLGRSVVLENNEVF